MQFFEKFFGGAFLLILVYLLVRNAGGVNKILQSFASGSSQVFSTLQGNGGNFGVNVNLGL